MNGDQSVPLSPAQKLTALVLTIPGVAAVYPSTPTLTRLRRTIVTTLGPSTPDPPTVDVQGTGENAVLTARVATHREPAPATARTIADQLRLAHEDTSARITVQIASISI